MVEANAISGGRIEVSWLYRPDLEYNGSALRRQSEPLMDGVEYRFVLRIASAACPEGIETQNTDEHAATPNSDVPASPALAVEII
jgi:hypothetical protein